MEAKQKYMTIPAAIRELEKVEMIRNGVTYKLDHAVTKTQKIILSSFTFSLDTDSVILSVVQMNFSKLLATSHFPINKEVPDDVDEEIR